MKKRVPIILVLVVIAGLSFLRRGGSSEAKEFCSLPFEERGRAFFTYPVEKQYSLYMSVDDEPACDMDIEPLSHYLASYMAEGDNGGTASYLSERLREEEDEEVQRDLIFALRAIATKGGLRGRKDIAEVVKRKAATMRGNFLDRFLGDEYPVKQSREFASEIESYIL